MKFSRIIATTKRVLTQLKHDPRTLALLFIVPALLIYLLKYVFEGNSKMFNSLVPMLLGVFPMIMMFLITSISTLRERKSGTLDRLMTMPISKIDFILGYALAFFVVVFIQSILICLVILNLLDVTVEGGVTLTIIGVIAAGLLGTSLGLLSSAFATTEFQAVQFMPAFLFPQLLVCGLFVPRSAMSDLLQSFSDFMPLTYSVDAMRQVTMYADVTGDYVKDLLIIFAVTVAALVIGSITIRRQEKP